MSTTQERHRTGNNGATWWRFHCSVWAASHKITNDSGQPPDIRCFRPNVVIDTHHGEPFTEDQWVGKSVIFGDTEDCPAVPATLRDQRCAMINLNPDTTQPDPAVLKTVAQLNQNCAEVYATVIRPGAMQLGRPYF